LAKTGVEEVAATGDPERFAEAYRALRADSAIQFEMEAVVPPEVPAWLRWLARLLEGSGPFFEALFWVVVAAAVLGILFLLARWAQHGRFDFLKRRSRARDDADGEGWRPEEAPARALLGEADALASAGRFSEAAHLLLFRSIEEIDKRRPQLVRPALTSRDIAGAPELPAGPRGAFARIVMMVERSLFGGRALGEPDWRDCRAAYEEFAFAQAWRG
jgi:hypothetical protein